jgi:hypothetical protein
MRAIARALLVVSLGAGLAIYAPPVAKVGAQVQGECDLTPSLGERCYAVLKSATDNLGSEVWVRVRDGFTYSPPDMHINETMWVSMQGGYWVEVGYFYGKIRWCGPTTSPTWYTARNRFINNYHYYWDTCVTAVPAPTIGSDHLLRIARLSSPTTSWLVSIDNVLVYNHTAMQTSSFSLQVGVETNHWATSLNNAWAYAYRHIQPDGAWSPSIWPNTSILLVGTPSAYGTITAPYAVFEHGFWGV